jgi:hypothetical protein
LAPARSKWHHGRGGIFGIGIGVAVIRVVVAYLLPKIPTSAKSGTSIKTLSHQWIVALIGVALLNVLSNAPPWMAALPGLGF